MIKTLEGYITYLPHLTDAAGIDGKTVYPIEAVKSNKTPLEKIEKIIKRYISGRDKEPTDERWDQLADEAYKMGLNRKAFDPWLDNVLSISNQVSPEVKILRQRYENGIDDMIQQTPPITRCSILIIGEGGLGKTTITRQVLNDFGLNKSEEICIFSGQLL